MSVYKKGRVDNTRDLDVQGALTSLNPFLHAQQNSNTSIPSGAEGILNVFGTVSLSRGLTYNSGTGAVTIITPGFYRISLNITASSTAGFVMYILKGSSAPGNRYISTAITSTSYASLSGVMELNAGDVIKPAAIGFGVGTSTYMGEGPSFFTVEKIPIYK